MIGNVLAAPHTEYCPQAVRDYVVTDRLVGNFDEALSLIRSALDGNTSKPPTCRVLRCRYIAFHGGAYTLVHGDTAARSRSEFEQLLTNHSWLPGVTRTS